jgi:hypothetical protein
MKHNGEVVIVILIVIALEAHGKEHTRAEIARGVTAIFVASHRHTQVGCATIYGTVLQTQQQAQ